MVKVLVLEIDTSSEALMEKRSFDADGKTRSLLKWHQFYTINEAYKLFCIDYPYIYRTSFYSCKPDHVVLRSETPANSCLCIYHENMRLMITSSNGFPNLKRHFISSIVCDSKRRDSMLQTCTSCGNSKVSQEIHQNRLEEDDQSIINYQQ